MTCSGSMLKNSRLGLFHWGRKAIWRASSTSSGLLTLQAYSGVKGTGTPVV